MSGNIEFVFVADEELYDHFEKPKPAYEYLPEWYERLDLDSGDTKTVKRCIPFREAMTTGWILPAPEDIYVHVFVEDGQFGMRSVGESGGKHTEPHAFEQVGGDEHPMMPNPIFKFLSPWIVRTPEGYSSWFFSPINRIERRWTSYSGIVDTDEYHNLIHFPTIWLAGEYEGMIERGTPLIQVVPFEREGLNLDGEVRLASDREVAAGTELHGKVESGEGVYRDEFWSPKRQARSE